MPTDGVAVMWRATMVMGETLWLTGSSGCVELSIGNAQADKSILGLTSGSLPQIKILCAQRRRARPLSGVFELVFLKFDVCTAVEGESVRRRRILRRHSSL